MTHHEGPPHIAPPKGGPCSNAIQLIMVFHSLIANIMADAISKSEVHCVEICCKIYLSSISVVDTHLQRTDKMPLWMDHSNGINTFNISLILAEFGPIRDLWEESLQGEVFIKHIQPLIIKGLSGKGATWLF